jgi:hypothetical protein
MLSRLIFKSYNKPFFFLGLLGGLGVHKTSTFVLIATTKKKTKKKRKKGASMDPSSEGTHEDPNYEILVLPWQLRH